MEKSAFEGKIGKVFTVQVNGGNTVELTLSSVDPIKKIKGIPETKNGVKSREQPFCLVFKGPKEHLLPDNTYTMTTEGWEGQMIFISAFKDDGEGMIHYDSVFA